MAVQIFQVMSLQGGLPDVITFAAVICACSNNQMTVWALLRFEGLRLQGPSQM